MKLYSLIFIVFLLGGCAEKSKVFKTETIHDLIDFDQNISSYISNSFEGRYISTLEKFESHYFMPWNIEKIDISLKDAKWAYRAFNTKNSYGENLQPLQNIFFTTIDINSNFEKFATLNKTAITLRALNIRAFPTEKPLFMDPNQAGEGFPFDYLQNSLIAPNKPILVSHYSKDREWVFIESSFTYGWVKAADIAFVPFKYTELYKKAEKVFFVKEGIGIYDDKNFLFRSRIGMMLPEITEDKKNFTVLAVSNYKISQPNYIKVKLSKDIVHHGILKFSKKNIIDIFNEVSKVKYGWGGMYGQRDCSSILRDFYAPFGVWLPRNSYKQSKVGKIISLKGLSDTEKIQVIKEKAIPFETLLYKRGHILLYVGIKNKKIIVFHNAWGIKTKKDSKEGRFIIGKPIFSTLKVGSDLKNYDKTASILSNLQSMNIITH